MEHGQLVGVLVALILILSGVAIAFVILYVEGKGKGRCVGSVWVEDSSEGESSVDFDFTDGQATPYKGQVYQMLPLSGGFDEALESCRSNSVCKAFSFIPGPEGYSWSWEFSVTPTEIDKSKPGKVGVRKS